VNAYCAATTSAGCAPADCETYMSDTVAFIASTGCGIAYWDWMSCVGTSGASCDDGGLGLPGSPSCDPPLKQCAETHFPCLWTSDAGETECSASCGEWKGNCVETASGLDCECEAGPHAGKKFLLANVTCNPDTYDPIRDHCK
jgi:hypothetical protein